jgi:hypothetical protein
VTCDRVRDGGIVEKGKGPWSCFSIQKCLNGPRLRHRQPRFTRSRDLGGYWVVSSRAQENGRQEQDERQLETLDSHTSIPPQWAVEPRMVR